jgi:predicted PurR-regulated permease PerM
MESQRAMETQRDLARLVLGVLFIGLLIGLSLWILKPFLSAGLWATTIAIATWPLMLRLQALLWNRRWIAVTVMTAALLLVFILPFLLAVSALVSHADEIAEQARALRALELPPLPAWVKELPLVGERIAEGYAKVVEAGGPALAAEVRPYLSRVVQWFAGTVGSVGALFVQFLLTVVFAAILYAGGEGAATTVRRFAVRLAGAQGERAVRLAAQATRGVALGVVLTAIVQSVAAGLGLVLAGVPFVGVLTAVMFMLTVAQLGPALVLVPSVIWLYGTGASGWGTFLLVWTIVVTPLDNILRPILIKRGADLSLLLVFTGVVGGLVAFGLVGIFIGPVVLAVSSTLLSNWIDTGLAATEEAGSPPSGL